MNSERTIRGGLSERESRTPARLTSQNKEMFEIDDLAEALETTDDAATTTASRPGGILTAG